MNSFNHYAYGAIGEWLYRTVAGIDVDAADPGYKHVLIQPQPGGGLTHVRATLDSPYGLAASAWELTEGDFRLQVTVPPNAHATVRLPAARLNQVTEGGRALAEGDGITGMRLDGDMAVIEIGSGEYAFVTTALNRAKAFANVRHVAGRLDRYSTLRELLVNDATKAAITPILGEAALNNPMAARVMDASLAQWADNMPAFISAEMLREVDAALSALPAS
jgi:alpha-L-rhamnosidase